MSFTQFRRLFVLAAFLIAVVGLAFAQQPGPAKVNVTVLPEEAYIFIDGHPYDHRSQTLSLVPGEYTIGIYNYGYVPQVQKVTLVAGDNPAINATLTPVTTRVSGPWGRIQIEGNPDDTAAVFLNGTLPEYFVGHIDEMNNDVWLAQQLIVPVGTYTMYIIHPRESTPFWSGTVEVRENERLIADIAKPATAWKYVPWNDGKTNGEMKRFDASTATASIAVAPVIGHFALDKRQINCGDPVRLTWNTAEAAEVFITANGQPMGKLPLTGTQTLQPLQNTTYDFRAVGPGGIVTSSQMVDVNKTPQVSLAPSPAEVHYQKVGDKVVVQEPSTLNWTAFNADNVRIEPFGPVTGTQGSVPLTLVPTQTGIGAVDETRTYTITATNACGGTTTSTASVRLTGNIEPEQVAEEKPPELPKTGSLLPLIGLLGFGSLAAGFVLRGVRKSLWNGD